MNAVRQRLRALGGIVGAKWRSRGSGAPIAVFHDFVPPPVGGGHQFMRALVAEFERTGLLVQINGIGRETRAVLFNSFNFRPAILRACLRPGVRCVHRLDGPMQTYRGFDDGTDRMVERINREFADVSVFQSAFSRKAHLDLGLEMRDGPVIGNAADPEIFRSRGDAGPGKVLRVFASSWSDNPNKGADVFEWLDRNGAGADVEVTFMGRCAVPLHRIRHLPPGNSDAVAAALRESDVFLTASRNDPCSNSVIEALTVGLPVVYRDSGGHPEIVGAGGVSFSQPEELPDVFARVRSGYAGYRDGIRVSTIAEIAKAYREVLL